VDLLLYGEERSPEEIARCATKTTDEHAQAVWLYWGYGVPDFPEL
jgi:hypothetical protein